MKSIISDRNVIGALLALCAVLGVFAETAQAADANLNMVFTTTSAGGPYGNAHVHVVWIENSSGSFVYTAGSTTTDNKRAVWAASRAYSLSEWWNKNTANRSADVAARTGATQYAYTTYNLNWNWKRKDGTTLPDGNYQVHFQCTNADNGNPSNKAVFNITKGPNPQVVGPTTQNGYNNVTLTFTPAGLGVAASPATNVDYTSATLNGEVTGTDGGVNPNVYIYWGDNDGGTAMGGWDHEISLNALGVGPFSTPITDLASSTTYYYRCRVVTTSPAKDLWTDPINFTTPTPDSAQIKLIPTAVDFEQVQLGSSSDIAVTVQNVGKLPLEINSLNFVGLESEVYSLVSPPALPLTIPAITGSVGLTIRFTPKSVQDYQYAQLAIGNNDPEDRAAYVELQGSGGPDAALGTRQVGGIGGSAKALAKYGDKILLGQGAMLVLLDVTNPAVPSKVNQIRLEGAIEAITVQGDVAYAALGNRGFAVVNLKDFTPLLGAATFETGGFAADIDSEGSTLCIADGIAGTHIYDISTPLEPAFVRTVETTGAVASVDISNGLIYILDESEGLLVLGLGADVVQVEAVAHWQLNETAGSIAPDSSLSDNDGTLMNMDDSDWVTGEPGHGNALDFDGINDYVQIASDAVLNPNISSWSTSFWLKSDTASQGTMIVSKRATAAPYVQYSIGLSAGNSYTWAAGSKLTFLFREATGIEKGGYTTSDIDISDWTHVCVVLDRTAGTVYVYIDGVPVPVTLDHDGTMPTINSSEPLHIGGIPGVLNHYQGLIDDVRIYNDTLTEGEVQGIASQKKYPHIEFGTKIITDQTDVYTVDEFGNMAILDAAGEIVPQSETLLQVGSNVDVEVQNDYAYVLGQAGLEVLNVSAPTSPVSVFADPNFAGYDLVVDGTVAYLAKGSAGLEILDISTPAAISSLGSYSLMAASSGVASDSLDEVYVVGNQQNLADYDLSAAAAPAVNETYESLFHAEDIEIEGTHAFVAAGLAGLNVFNLSNPGTPAVFATGGFATAVSVNGSTAMVCDSNDVYVVDVSSPMSPSLVGSMSVLGWGSDVAVGSTHGYVAEGGRGISILDLSNAQLVGSYPVAGLAYGVAIDGDTLYVACGTEGITVLDVTDPANPSLIAEYDLPGMIVDVAKVGDRLCVADATYGVSILDVSTPASPTLYASAATRSPAYHVSSAGSRILVADRNGGLAVLGVTEWPKVLVGNISGDDQVNLDDLRILAGQWLFSETGLDAIEGNIHYYDTTVNLKDLSVLAANWLAVIPNDAPSFTSDPINEIAAYEGVAYSSSIADDASDPEDDPMTFSKESGPAWLTVAADGTLSGIPSDSDVGVNVFTVRVNATGGSDTATLNITVVAVGVVYHDTFDNDGLATNAGTGGGLEAVSFLDNGSAGTGTNWDDNGDLSRAAGTAGDRAVVSSLNSFDLSGGFTLTVKWTGTNSLFGDSFGLSTERWTTDAASLPLKAQDPFGYGGIGGHKDSDSVAAQYAYYGIGLAYATTGDISDPYDKGLIFNDASGIAGETGGQRQQLSNPAIPTSGSNTFVLTVTGDQYSYSINGAPETTGEIVDGTGTFDLSQPFYFNAYSQNGATTITEVMVVSISEPI